MFLTHEQLKELTGYETHAGQEKWLAKNGYNFDVRKDGRPNVLKQQLFERQCKTPVNEAFDVDLSWMDEAS